MNKRRRGDTKDNPLAQWYTKFSEADELSKFAAARQQVSVVIRFPLFFMGISYQL